MPRFSAKNKINMRKTLNHTPVYADPPANTAVQNLYKTVFGHGIPVETAKALGKTQDLRVIVAHRFGNDTYLSAVLGKTYMEKIIKLQAHLTTSLNTFIVSTGVKLLRKYVATQAPLMFIAQLPTRALWRSYDTTDLRLPLPLPLLKKTAEKPLWTYAGKKVSKTIGYLPGSGVLKALSTAVGTEYPAHILACDAGIVESVDECVHEVFTAVADQQLATLIYVVNTSVYNPFLRPSPG